MVKDEIGAFGLFSGEASCQPGRVTLIPDGHLSFGIDNPDPTGL
jgi:hypothetical protein